MSCCSISKAVRKLSDEASRVGDRFQSKVIDPVREEASRIESKTRAELKRVPDNIDKATAKIKESVQDVFSQAFSLIPGSGAVKLIGIGLAVIVGLSILRRVRQ